MPLYKGYLYISNPKSLALVTAESKGEIIILDTFSVDATDYINENGVILYPLSFAEEISKKFNCDKYSVKDLTLIISPTDAVVSVSKEQFTDNPKKLGVLAKSRILTSSNILPEAYEFGWHSPGSILDDGNPYTILLTYNYAKRHVEKLSKVFESAGMKITRVILPELAMSALYEQYKSEYTDPDYLIIESGYINSSHASTTCYWYKRNILNDITAFSVGIKSIVSTIQTAFNHLTKETIWELIFGCGFSKTYAPEEADDILGMHGIKEGHWYEVCEPLFESYVSTIASKILNKKVDEIILAGDLCLIPGITQVFSKYQVSLNCWENEYEVPLEKKELLWLKENKASAQYAILFGAVYFDNLNKDGKSNFPRIPGDKLFRKKEPKFNHQSKAPVIIGITGAERGAGTTTLCVELARYLTKHGRVAILDKTERDELAGFLPNNIDLYTSNLGKIDVNRYNYILVDFGVFYEIGKIDGYPTIITDSKTVIETNVKMSIELSFCKRVVCVCPAAPWKLYKTDFLVNNLASAKDTANWILIFNGDTETDEFASLDIHLDVVKSYNNTRYLEELISVI